METKCAAIEYADGIAIISDPICMQTLIDIYLQYSPQWKLKFSPTKCASVCFGETET